MIIKTYFDDGKILVSIANLAEEINEKEAADEILQNFFKQISEGRYICIPEGKGNILINADHILRIEIQPTEKENANVTSE